MKFVLLALSISFIMAACQSSKNTSSADSGKSGIKGTVLWVTGNQMPRISPDGSSATPKHKGVKRTIEFHKPLKMADLSGSAPLFEKPGSSPIATTTSDEDGNFQISLPAGNYSVFTVEEKGWFANSFNTQNEINVITVEEGKFTEVEIKVNYTAAY